MLALAACAGRPAVPGDTPASAPVVAAPAPAPDASVPDAAAAPEASVRPGVNDQYRRNEDVGEWLERFETGGREIFARRDAIVAAAGVRAGMIVADVGSGTGLFTVRLARAVGATGHVYAEDILPKFLKHVEARVRDEKLTNVTTVLGTDRSLGLADGSLDLVFVCDVYHHFEYPRSMLASIRRALKPTGVLFVIDLHKRGVMHGHVRAPKQVVMEEIAAAGFELVDDVPLLQDNYVLRYRLRRR
jgi:ubiquinone/menaquinone biosynthesis C-methylase UbiE